LFPRRLPDMCTMHVHPSWADVGRCPKRTCVITFCHCPCFHGTLFACCDQPAHGL